MNPATKMKWLVMYYPSMIKQGTVWQDDYAFYVKMLTTDLTLNLTFFLN